MTPLEKKYVGKTFVFHSPFEYNPGWKDGDKGTIVRVQSARRGDNVEGDIRDFWLATNPEGELCSIWGGEAFTPRSNRPLIKEHAFIDWKPA